jgi:XTP/dITP diphosphohydrolase
MTKFTGKKLLIGSHSKYKITQLSKYFTELGHNIELTSPAEFNVPAPPEVGTTFEENCQIKAKYYGDSTGLVSISDDSGICIDVLKGAPGVYTADWAIDGDFAPAIARMAREINAEPGGKYDAKMVSVISIYSPNSMEMQSFRAETNGYVNFDLADIKGIGFQPVFYPYPYSIPVSLIDERQYMEVNARAKSLKKLLDACF